LHDNCPKNIFHVFLWGGHATRAPYPNLLRLCRGLQWLFRGEECHSRLPVTIPKNAIPTTNVDEVTVQRFVVTCPQVTAGSFVRTNGSAKPNPNPNPNGTPTPTLTQTFGMASRCGPSGRRNVARNLFLGRFKSFWGRRKI